MSNEKTWVCPYCKADFPAKLRSAKKTEIIWTVHLDGEYVGYEKHTQYPKSEDKFFCGHCGETLGFNEAQLCAGLKAGFMERESMLNYDEKFGACNWCANDVTEQAEGEVEITRLEALELLRKYGKRLDSCGIEDGWIIISDMLQEFQEERV